MGALGWLVVREYSGEAGGTGEPPSRIRLPPTTTFYSLRAGTAQVGLASITTDTLPGGLRVTSRVDVDVPLPVVPRRLLVVTEALYDGRLQLQSFTTTASGEAGQMTVTATVSGDSLLMAVVAGRGLTTSDTVVLAVPSGVLLPDAVPLALATRGDLHAGGSRTLQVLDPLELAVRPWDIVVRAESVIVVPDSAAFDSVSGRWTPAGHDTLRASEAIWSEHGLPVRAWIDRRGGVIERTTPLGLTQRREPFEIVNSGYVRRRPRNIQSAPLEVAAPVTTAAAPAGLRFGPATVQSAAPMLTTPWQTVTGGRLDTRAGPPIRARIPTPIPDSVEAIDRRPPTSVRIGLEARRIVAADTLDQAKAVGRLAAWVGSAVVPGPPILSDPERTLLRRRGDSSDRAELMAGMARSLGIPARTVAGLLFSGGRFRYRAWTEVWLGTWVPVDPTLGQFPADAGHARLLTRSTARPATIVTLLGAIRPTFITPTTTP